VKGLVASIGFVLLPLSAWCAEPRVLVDGYQLELVAHEPDIVTPIGMAFDAQGRLLVVESHTHQRPDDYAGPVGDRIRMLADSDGDSRLDRWSTFAEGFQQAMNLCVRPDGGVYLVTRRDVRLLEDRDGDGRSDRETRILWLETEGDYPHNGMSGIVFDPVRGFPGVGGTIYLGLGENFGFPYKLHGADGSIVEGRGGVGAIFMCTPDGEQLKRIAIGFWNPFSLCTAGQAIFCVDNDPDASPPCRLIRVLPAGDYGHRWEYGRAGVHPLQAWNGELPGTLPMICGTGEAPTALIHHRGYLWVTSWGDHRIERYAASVARRPVRTLSAQLEVAVQGDADFRPTGAAIAPDGSIYFADWVSRSYPVHWQGRIWRLETPAKEPAFADDAEDGAIPWSQWGARDDVRQFEIFADKQIGGEIWESSKDPALRLSAMQRARWHATPDAAARLRTALRDRHLDVRLYAVRWIADERIAELRDDVAKLLDGEIPSERYFLAVLAAIDWLDSDATPRTSGISDELLQRELANDARSPQLHALALRLISPDHEWLTLERMRAYLDSESAELRLEAVRTLTMQSNADRFALLAEVADDSRCDLTVRAEAVVGLAADVEGQAELLETLADGDEPTVAREARRVLALSRKRPEEGDEGRPDATEVEAWNRLLAEGGDAAAGRRLFFMPMGPQCAACHQHGGRGGRVGPDLTNIGRQQSRERIIASILQPSREVAPHYQAWTLLTADGLSHAGLRLPKAGDDGEEVYADANGREFKLRSEDIELRQPSDVSIMPDGFERTLTVEGLRDLVAFLASEDAAFQQRNHD
jgi:putative membrane-bound dehydrogenase-like protein